MRLVGKIISTSFIFPLIFSSCEKGPQGYEVDADAVVLEAYGPNPVLRGNDLTFIGQNMDRITSVILPEDIEVPSSQFKDVSASTFKVTVPMECEPGDVVLVYEDGAITARTPLAYTEQFSITSVSPVDEILEAGDSVTVEGEYLNNIVRIVFVNGGAEASGDEIGTQNRHTLRFAVPADAQTGLIYAEDANGNQVYSKEELMISCPVITSVSPSENLAPGAKITIVGQYLDLVTSVTFSGAEAIEAIDFESQSATEIVITELPETAKAGPVTVTTATGLSFTSEISLTMAKPSNLSFEDDSDFRIGRSIYILGDNLSSIDRVRFTGSAKNARGNYSANRNRYNVTVPDDAQNGPLTIITTTGEEIPTDLEVTLEMPQITGITSENVMAGTEFQITLSPYENSNKPGDPKLLNEVVTAVALNGTACEYTVVSSTKITAKTTATSKSGKVTLTFVNGYTEESEQSLTVDYSFTIDVATITSPVELGNDVTMTGAGFSGIESIVIGANIIGKDDFKSLTDNEIVFAVPEDWTPGDYQPTFILASGAEELSRLMIDINSGDLAIWEGDFALGNWSNNLELTEANGYSFANLQYGATISVRYTITASGAQIKFADLSNGWADMPGINGGTFVTLEDGTDEIHFELTNAEVDILRNHGVALQGKDATLTGVYIKY